MMTAVNSKLVVKTHVARDLLQSAALFKTERLVVWEYVSNGLQYVDPGMQPVVRVVLDARNKRITISDNGRGMDWADLQNYFIMHGENVDRKAGRGGRGRFGTGKSAAFGIADVLRITTVRAGKKSSVRLRRTDIEKAGSGEEIPIDALLREEATIEPNGTVIDIEHIHLRALDQAGIIAYVERHLAHWQGATVFIGHHECEFNEPPIAREIVFSTTGDFRRKLGDVQLHIKVSKALLDEELRGIAIYSNEVWYETTLAGNEGREMSQYIFGEIDVPNLDSDKSPIPPFDMSRSMSLNPSNELVQAIYAFIGEHVDRVRRELVEEERRRRRTEEARRLQKAADEIAKILNEDFDAFRKKLAKVRATADGGADLDRYSLDANGAETDALTLGQEEPAKEVAKAGSPGSQGENGKGGSPPNLRPQVEQDQDSVEKRGRPFGNDGGSRSRPRGGFSVSFENSGAESPRAKYDRSQRKIYINLDHPQIASAKGDSPDDNPIFRHLVNEIAFTEYAIGLIQELISKDEFIDLTEPVVEIRETINRLARRAASLYSKSPQ